MSKVRFCVQILVSDQWMTLEGAESLPQWQAHAIGAEESQVAGPQRVRVLPVHNNEQRSE